MPMRADAPLCGAGRGAVIAYITAAELGVVVDPEAARHLVKPDRPNALCLLGF